MHVGNMDKGMVPGIAIVGGGIPLAAGHGAGVQDAEAAGVVACFFGDGAVAEGAFHEGVNLAAIWDLPVIFVCENNLYGASTRVDQVMRAKQVADRAAATASAAGRLTATTCWPCTRRRERPPPMPWRAGPVLLELLTYRRTGHSRRDPATTSRRSSARSGWARPDRTVRQSS